MAPRELNFITGNKNKLTEVQAILGSVVYLQSQSLDLVEIQGTIEEISVDKCRRAAELVNCPSFQNPNGKYLKLFRSRARY
jgi:inosine triphosphate pyrophosphatase